MSFAQTEVSSTLRIIIHALPSQTYDIGMGLFVQWKIMNIWLRTFAIMKPKLFFFLAPFRFPFHLSQLNGSAKAWPSVSEH